MADRDEIDNQSLKDAVTFMLKAATALDVYCAEAEEGVDIALEVTTSTYLRTRADRLIPPRDAWPVDESGKPKVIDLMSWKKRAL